MSFGAGATLAGGNPIGAALSIFTQLVTLFQDNRINALVNKLRKMQDQFRSLGTAGMFGSQQQRRAVENRTIWEQIGYAQPEQVPHIFARTPPGTSFVVKDRWPVEDFTQRWSLRRQQDFAGELRFADRAWYGSRWRVSAGDPTDTIPGIGRDGVHRHEFTPSALASGLAAQPRQYLGPRALAGEDAAAKRAAFAAGGGNVAWLWGMALDEQAKREGRRVRAWGGRGWLDSNPNGELFDEKVSTVYHGPAFNGRVLPFGVRGSTANTLLEFLGIQGFGIRGKQAIATDEDLRILESVNVFGPGFFQAGASRAFTNFRDFYKSNVRFTPPSFDFRGFAVAVGGET